MSIFRIKSIIFCLFLHSALSFAGTVINTSFESGDNYAPGTIDGKQHWKVTSGAGMIVASADYVHDGFQALQAAASGSSLQLDYIPYASNTNALGGDVYVDFYIRHQALPSANFSITAYDLGADTHRSLMLDFLPGAKIKLYDGSSGWSTQPVYAAGSWIRISVKIDNGSGKYQLAINGNVYDKLFSFREIKNNATVFDFHSIRFSMSSGTCDVAIDQLYIGSDPIEGIHFQESSSEITIRLVQPEHGLISLDPQKESYELNEQVTAAVLVPDHYVFNGWTGDLSGTENPKTFSVTGNMSIGATVLDTSVVSVTHLVSTATQFKTALSIMNPGDTILVADGIYNLGGVKVIRGGSSLKPVVVKSKNLHGAVITGKSTFTLSGQSHVVYEGFDFDLEPVSTIFKMEGCSYVRITRNRFRMQRLSESQSSKWITIGDVWENPVCNSHHNRIDHNLFEGKYDSGAWVVIDGSHGDVPDISRYDRIDHNIFRTNTPRVANEKETIRMGVSDLSNLDAFTVVESNLFEDCDGDPEIVSVKSNSNIVRNNTFRRCLGTLSLRQGNNSLVEGNFFFGEGKTAIYESQIIGCGGVRVYGMNHRVVNNYFEGLTGSKWDAACTLTNGDVTNSSANLSSHFLPENVVFAFNTFVGNESNVEIGFDNGGKYGKAPKNCRFDNNIIVSGRNEMIKSYSTASLAGLSFSNNLLHPTGTATVGLSDYDQTEFLLTDPLLVRSTCRAYPDQCDYQIGSGLYKLSSGSPAIDASLGYADVLTDMEGQPVSGMRDIGADEFNAAAPVLNGPVDETKAGPSASDDDIFENYIPASAGNVKSNVLRAEPNPCQGFTYLQLPDLSGKEVMVSIYTASGILLKNEMMPVSGNRMRLDLNANGLLFVKVSFDATNYVVKIISE